MSSHPVGHERKAITADDGIFVVLAQLPDVRTTGRSKCGHELLLGTWVRNQEQWVFARCEEVAGKGEGALAVVRIGLELSRPGFELFPGWLTHE
jgi:hypothetical protein